MKKIVLVCVVMGLGHQVLAGICKEWSPSVQVGSLDKKLINEASGLAVSRTYSDRLYHINDSGDGPNFYVTDVSGSQTEKVKVKGFKPNDVEDLAYGRCGSHENCIYIGDIGDNLESRKSVKIVELLEKRQFGKEVSARNIVEARYPDRAQNAEGMALHPNGDLYIVTKAMDFDKGLAAPARVYRLNKNQLQDRSGKVQELTYVGEINLPMMLNDHEVFGQIVTAFDISPDGKRLLLLTYMLALEVEMDLSIGFKKSEGWKLGLDFNRISTLELPQQEAISYTAAGTGLLYNTEYKKFYGDVPIYSKQCLRY